MDSTRTLIEQSRQLIASARAAIDTSRRIRANVQSTARRAQRIRERQPIQDVERHAQEPGTK